MGRQSELERLIKTFRAKVSEVMAEVSAEVERMDAADAVSRAAAEADDGARRSSASSEEASGVVASVSAAAEELAASIGEIARQTFTGATPRDFVAMDKR